jgi:myosin heavy subunit
MLKWKANTTKEFNKNMIQPGKTKLFLRKESYEFLESRRVLRRAIAATRMQAWMRRKLARIKYITQLKKLIYLQTWFTKVLFRKREKERRRKEREARMTARARGEVVLPAASSIKATSTKVEGTKGVFEVKKKMPAKVTAAAVVEEVMLPKPPTPVRKVSCVLSIYIYILYIYTVYKSICSNSDYSK